MKKRWIALGLAAAMAVSMTACTSNTKNESGDSSNTADKKFTVGICQLATHPALDAATKGFREQLEKELPGQVEFKEQNAAGDSNTCTTIVNGFVASKVDLILANATASLQAATAATNTIPILGTSVTEYGVALNIKDFTGTVGTNVSGTSDLAPLAQQAAMLKEWFPDKKNVGLLYCSAEPNSQYQVDTVQKELEKLGYTCKQYAFSGTNDVASIAQAAADASDVLYVPTDNTGASNAGVVDNICRPAKVPVIAGEEGICSGCGVATLSISYYDLGVATGKMAAKILKGESKVSEMPIEYAPQFTKKYNKTICDALGLKVPDGYTAIES